MKIYMRCLSAPKCYFWASDIVIFSLSTSFTAVMTTLCTNCINFDIEELTNELRRDQIGPKQPVIDPLANTDGVELTKLWGFQVVLVEQGARLGCVFCSLLLEAVSSNHIAAAKQQLKENC